MSFTNKNILLFNVSSEWLLSFTIHIYYVEKLPKALRAQHYYEKIK